jgi:rhamnosyl/mannosyltransferase
LKSVKILLVVSELPPARSGVASSAKLLVEHYRRLGHDVSTIAMRSLPNFVRGELRLSFFFLRWPSIRREALGAQLVHLHGPAPTFSDLFLLLLRLTIRRSRRPKVIYTQHFELDIPGVRILSRLYNRWHSRLLRLADAVVTTTKAYERVLVERGHRKVVVIPWGADHLSYPSSPAAVRSKGEDRSFDILAVGQLRSYKGLEVLLRALTHVPGARLHIVGEGHLRSRYEALASRLSLSNVRFHGDVSDADLSALFTASRVIVLASVSRMEAFGMALLEGMRAGCVPVASNLPGVAEVVGDAGILVQPGDAPALAEALRALQRDRALWERLSARARFRADSFRWTETASRYVALLEELLLDSKASGAAPARDVRDLRKARKESPEAQATMRSEA